MLDAWAPSIVRAYVSRSLFGVAFLRKRAGFLIRNGYPFCIAAGDVAQFLALWTGLAGGPDRPRSIRDPLQARGIPSEYVVEISGERVRRELDALAADVFLFAPFDLIADEPLLSIPRLGTFNVHLGKLPEYRGGLSAFWILRYSDPVAGATVHRVVRKLDAGEILAEVRFPVRTTSMFHLMRETVSRAGPLVVSALADIGSGSWRPIDTSGRREGYYFLPRRADLKEFYSRGHRLI